MLNKQESPLFFFNDTATTEIYTLSLHDALPILRKLSSRASSASISSALGRGSLPPCTRRFRTTRACSIAPRTSREMTRSEEHTSELQSRQYLVCRLLLEKKT